MAASASSSTSWRQRSLNSSSVSPGLENAFNAGLCQMVRRWAASRWSDTAFCRSFQNFASLAGKSGKTKGPVPSSTGRKSRGSWSTWWIASGRRGSDGGSITASYSSVWSMPLGRSSLRRRTVATTTGRQHDGLGTAPTVSAQGAAGSRAATGTPEATGGATGTVSATESSAGGGGAVSAGVGSGTASPAAGPGSAAGTAFSAPPVSLVIASRSSGPARYDMAQRDPNTTGSASPVFRITNWRLSRLEMSVSKAATSVDPPASANPSTILFLSFSVWSRPIIHVPAFDIAL